MNLINILLKPLKDIPLSTDVDSFRNIGQDGQLHVFNCRGTSMAPFIPSGSSLYARNALEEDIQPGHVICYVTHLGPVAHRVMGVRKTSSGRVLMAKGDSTDLLEEIPFSAAVYLAEKIEHSGFAYRTDSIMGKFIALSALRGGHQWSAVSALARLLKKFLRNMSKRP